MRSKEDYYGVVKEIRKVLNDPINLKCTCPNVKCEWHGNCKECVAIHRFYKDHIPKCMQEIVNDKIIALAQIGELNVTKKENTPSKYWDYVNEEDNKEK